MWTHFLFGWKSGVSRQYNKRGDKAAGTIERSELRTIISMRKKVILTLSGGKESSLALYALQITDEDEIVTLQLMDIKNH